MALQIGTFLWFDPGYRWNRYFRYTAEHVNKLYRGLSRHLTIPVEFFCITDIPEGLDPKIRVIPLWSDLRSMGGCYLRLKAFSKEMGGLIGPRFALLDVDSVITRNCDAIFEREEPFLIWKPQNYCASMLMMDAGCRSEVWEDFDPETSPSKGTLVGTDQRWIGHKIPNEAVWTEDDGILNGHRLRKLPSDARIVFFPGRRDPSTLPFGWIDAHWK